MLVKQFEYTTAQKRVRTMLAAKPGVPIYIQLNLPSLRGFNDHATGILYKRPSAKSTIKGERLFFTVEALDRLDKLLQLIGETRWPNVHFVHDNEIFAFDDFIVSADRDQALVQMMKNLDAARPMRCLDTPYTPKNRVKKDPWRKRLFLIVSNNFEHLNGHAVAIPEVSNRDEHRDVICRFHVISDFALRDTVSALVAASFNRDDYRRCVRGHQGDMPALETAVMIEVNSYLGRNITIKAPSRRKKLGQETPRLI